MYVEDANKKWQLQPVPLQDTIQIGDEIEVSLTIQGSREYGYIKLMDHIPAGFSFIRKNRQWHEAGRTATLVSMC